MNYKLARQPLIGIAFLLLLSLSGLKGNSQDALIKNDSLKVADLKRKLPLLAGPKKVDCLIEISRELDDKEGYPFAQQAIKEALRLNYSFGIAFSLIQLGYHINQTSRGDAESIDTLKRAIAIGELLKQPDILGWAYDRMGAAYYYKQKGKAIECWKKAIGYFEKAGDAQGIAENALWICGYLIYQGEYEEAFPYCEMAVVNFRKKRDHKSRYGPGLFQEALFNMSKLYEASGDFQGAMNCLMEARDYGVKMKYDWFMDDAIGLLYSKIGGHDSALYLLTRNMNTQQAKFYPSMFLAGAYLSSLQYKKAFELLKPYADSTGWQRVYPALRLNLGKSLAGIGDFEKALPFARQAVTSVTEPNEKLDGYLLLSEIFHNLSKEDSAYYYMKKYARAKDSISNKQFQWRLNEKLYRFQRSAEDRQKANQMALLQKDILIKAQLLREEELIKKQKDIALQMMDNEKKLVEEQLQKQVFQREQNEARIALLDSENKIKEQKIKQQNITKKFLLGGLFLFLLIGFIVFRNIHLKRRNEKLEADRKESELKMDELKTAKEYTEMHQRAIELEMQALRAQMNPHFIFNCLSSINKYILKNEMEDASDYLTRFSRLIRMVLIHSEKSLISLEDELDMLRLYLDMERLRFNNVFNYHISFVNTVEPAAIFIPPMLLQPFCENSIWHGLMHKEGPGQLDISFRMEADILHCSISDNGVGREKANELRSKSSEREKSLGLKITRSRLELFNSGKLNDSGFEMNDIRDTAGNIAGTRVDIRIRHRSLVDKISA